ncbi:RES family NAD+ phosphorylase [uncultured Caulobacter sp.]|uniref:RES family NAD+ phosphorylase n=1 Tax=uncultured Caulobacter sp. TaxID=158749 RepID=UPI00262B7FCF|nr:RES family NAD+ phosphorylase [uncultured Caulobacter sp.]
MPLEIPKGTEIVRVHWQNKGSIFFGPKLGLAPGNRFDAPAGEYRTLYAAIELPGAYVETVLRRPGRVIRRSEADGRAATRLQIQRPLRLAKIFDEGLHWHGVHAGEISVDDYGPSRQLALDLFEAFPEIDGLAYRSRFDNGQVCYALYDRLSDTDLAPTGRLDFDKHPSVVDDLMKLYGASFDTSPLP